MNRRVKDLDKGEIYLLKNKHTGECYVGQAKKYMSTNHWRWGTIGRWKSHIREAMSGKDHCVYLNNAIRKYGPENFEVTTICDCLLTEMDDLERHYIKEYNSMVPNGYNIKEGGQYKPSVERIKKSLNKYETDYKHVYPIFLNHKLIGYKVSGLIDHEGKSVPDRVFTANTNPSNLYMAIKFVDQAQDIISKQASTDWLNYEIANRVNNDDELLPAFVASIYNLGVKCGYKVSEYPFRQPDGTIKRITKQFASSKFTVEQNLQKTLDFLNELKGIAFVPQKEEPCQDQKDMTEIYIIRNRENGMSFIGRAKKFLYSGKKPFGYLKCWEAHLRDYEKENDGDFPKLHKAMKEFGPSNFEIQKLCDCDDNQCIAKTKEFIQLYNTLAPNGYNLTDGGKGGKKSQEAIERQKIAIAQKTDEQKKQTSERLRQANLGKVQDKNSRKHAEDEALPKYISAIRKEDKLIGYRIDKFPTGVGEKKIRKDFKCMDNPKSALERAKKHLDELKLQYATPMQKDADEGCESHACKKAKQLPENIFPLYTENHTVKGYKVEGDNIPYREFTESYNNHVNLDRAVKYVEQTQQGIHNSPDSDIKRRKKTIGMLPKYMRYVRYDGVIKGYAIEGLTYTDDNGKTVEYSKNFTNQNHTLEENFQLAKNNLQDILNKINHGS